LLHHGVLFETLTPFLVLMSTAAHYHQLDPPCKFSNPGRIPLISFTFQQEVLNSLGIMEDMAGGTQKEGLIDPYVINK